MSVLKKAHELRPGDKILGNTNYFIVEKVDFNGMAGSFFPVITVKDSNGNGKVIDTGSTQNLQNHIYECDSN